jgi:hypothetical protein
VVLGRSSGWRGESLLSIGWWETSPNRLLCHDPFPTPLAEPASEAAPGADFPAGQQGFDRVWSRRHRAPSVCDAGGRGLAAFVGPGRLEGEAPTLAIPAAQ